MKRVLLVGLTLTLCGCGAREALVQPEGKPMPVTPYAVKEPPKADDLLADRCRPAPPAATT